ncbi:MAG: phosphoribosyltransferase [Ferruginibacter sp.]|nr:phosphoribosyltransferase [Chitinophagaceae bacterium]MBP6286385.1 phosphoribosyltransferase [Ferruginibacter sp.]MBU9936626.1 phosphoribosyltransferase [Ferruginibacter sp.]HQY12864.1 phosphoribosyltransferase family protein [Ferruginibacter sp.]
MKDKKYILSAEVADKKLRRMALQVVEQNYDAKQLILIGIRANGIFIANIISKYLQEVFKGEVIVLELSMDKKKPSVIRLDKQMDFNGKTILLIDDVANSGRTMLYALKPLLEQLPEKIQTLALVERTHKTFPIDVDYTGLSVSTTKDEHIVVEVKNGQVAGAWME